MSSAAAKREFGGLEGRFRTQPARITVSMMHARIAGSELKILPRLRHSLLVEAPDTVADLILDFIQRDARGGDGGQVN